MLISVYGHVRDDKIPLIILFFNHVHKFVCVCFFFVESFFHVILCILSRVFLPLETRGSLAENSISHLK